VVFGTHEETYLALYAAGVFILLSLTGWAAVKRLVRESRQEPSAGRVAAICGTGLAALLASGATVIIFEERFTDGAWLYLVVLPVFWFVFSHYRRRLGPPRSIDNRLGKAIASSNLPPNFGDALYAGVSYANILVPLDQSPQAELALAQAQTMARNYTGTIRLLTVLEGSSGRSDDDEARVYLNDVAEDLGMGGYRWEAAIGRGTPAEVIGAEATAGHVDLVVISTHAHSRLNRWVASHVATDVIHQTTPPLLLIRPTESWRSTRTRFQRVLVTLDGSETAEQVLPHVHEIGSTFGGHVTLLSVSEGSQADDHADKLHRYLSRVAERLAAKAIVASVRIAESAPSQAIFQICEEESIDLIMMVSHGRGGVERQDSIKLGSVVENVIQAAPCPVFLVSATKQPLAATVAGRALAMAEDG
jgi:nucleotide-binding universal stress UspA family protein